MASEVKTVESVGDGERCEEGERGGCGEGEVCVQGEGCDGEGCEEGGCGHDNLLRKLEEQNRRLESDRKCRTVIVGRSSSFRSISDTESINSLRTGIITEEHSTTEEVMSSQSCDLGGEERRGRGESDSLVRLRTESELSGEISSGSKSPNLGGGEEGSEGPREGETEADVLKEEGEDSWLVWSEVLKYWEENSKRNQKQVRQLVRDGIPGALRGMAWQLMSGAQDHTLRDRYPALLTEMSPFERQIQRDLARTFPEHSFFKDRDGLGQEALLNILKAYSVYDREVGYCQGSPFITGLLLMQKMPEEDAFCVFVRLMYDYKLRDLFKPSMADLGLCFFQLEKLVEELYPALHSHFQNVEFHTSMYASPWFLTMFASVLSLNVVFRVMDIFLVEGRETVFKVGLALLEHSQDKLLQLDMEEMLKHFQKEMKTIHEANPDTLIKKAQRIKLNPRRMKKLEKDYQVRRERQAMENMELLRLQQSNIDLQKSVKSLEQECSALADKLIQGQVSRAQEAEEMFIIKKELAKARRRLAEMEERQSRKESTESNESLHEESPKIVSGEGGSGRGDDGGEDGEGEEVEGEEEGLLFDCGPEPTVLQDEETAKRLQVKSPDHVTREEAVQVLRKLGVRSPVSTHENSSLLSSVTKEHKRCHGNTNSSNHNSSSSGGVTSSSTAELNGPSNENNHTQTVVHDTRQIHSGGRRRRKSRERAEEMMQELARAKLESAEAAASVEQKKMEVRQALLRESQAVREVEAARSYIAVLEQRLSECQMEKLSCPHCSQKLGKKEAGNDPSDPNSSSDVLFSHLRAMWNSQQVGSPSNGSPNRTPRYAPSWT